MKQLLDNNASVVNIINDNDYVTKRTFGYALNIKRAKAKLLKGVKRPDNVNIEKKSGCVNLRFSVGAYHEVVKPLLVLWKERINEEFVINKTRIKVIEVDEGLENTTKAVDTKIVALVNNEKIVLHSYNTTQNVMVQGKNREDFVFTVLELTGNRTVQGHY